jgi:hypothetical protein
MNENMHRIVESMSAWGGQGMQEFGLWPFVTALLVSAIAAFFVSFLYVNFYSSRATGSHLHQAFPLLGIAITAVFICIQFSLPLSLGLLGALSIVRFRTPIKEPEEIGFIMVVIACSLACATMNFHFLVILLFVALLVLFTKRYTRAIYDAASQDGSVIISLPELQYEEKGDELLELLESSLPKAKIESVSKGRDEVVLSLFFRGLSPKGLLDVEKSFRAIVKPSNFTVVYNRPGKL